MALNITLVRTYTRNVYLYGTYELHDNKGAAVSDVHPTYVNAVMQNARNTLTEPQILNAEASNYITAAEKDATMLLVPGDPIPGI